MSREENVIKLLAKLKYIILYLNPGAKVRQWHDRKINIW